MAAATESIVLIGFGEVGQVLADDLLARGDCRVEVFDIRFDDPDSVPAQAARKRSLTLHADAAAALAAGQRDGPALVFCAVTAAADLDAARACAGALVEGSYYADCNSASPNVKQQAAALIDAGAGAYVEVAVMSPIFPKRSTAPMLLGGTHAEQFAARVQPLGFAGCTVHSAEIGPASATKMCRSVFVKGMEALISESMLSARYYGVEDGVLESLSNLFPNDDWRRFARYMISRTIEHGGRRAEEMREVVETVKHAGVQPWMSAACVERQQWAPQHQNALEHEDLGPFLDAIRANMSTGQ